MCVCVCVCVCVCSEVRGDVSLTKCCAMLQELVAHKLSIISLNEK